MSPVPSDVPAVCARCAAPLAVGLAGNCPACLTVLALDAEAETAPELPRQLGDFEILDEISRGDGKQGGIGTGRTGRTGIGLCGLCDGAQGN